MPFKFITIIVMALFYMGSGLNHFINSGWFVQIMPPYLPWHLELVYLSGVFEILFGALLCFKKTRFVAAWGIILLLIAVYPANIYLAFNDIPQEALGVSSFMASWVRLPMQFLFIGLAYWHSQDTKRF